MSISMNNHENRIKALENKIGTGGGIVESKTSIPGYAKFANGLLIQFGTTSGSSYKTVTFPKAFTSKPVMSSYGVSNFEAGYTEKCCTAGITTTQFRIGYHENASNFTLNWIAIGY